MSADIKVKSGEKTLVMVVVVGGVLRFMLETLVNTRNVPRRHLRGGRTLDHQSLDHQSRTKPSAVNAGYQQKCGAFLHDMNDLDKT